MSVVNTIIYNQERHTMSDAEFKWANKLHWMVKGHLIPQEWASDEKQVESVVESYTRRLWGNHEACVHLSGFDEAWGTKYGQSKN